MLFSRSLLLVLSCWAALALSDRVRVNRRARQRLPDSQTGASSVRGQLGVSGPTGRSSDISPAREYGPRYYETSSRARVPRRRSQSVRGGGGGGRTTVSPQLSQAPPAPAPISERSVSRARSRARIPRRRVNPNRDLERNERNALSIQVGGLTEDFSTVSQNRPTTTTTRSRSRSRSRYVSEGRSEVRGEVRGEVMGEVRGEVRGRGRTVTRKTDVNVSPRLSVPAPSSRAQSEERERAGPQVIFPRKNLFPKLKKKFFLGDNEVDTGGDSGLRAAAPYKSVNKERLRSSLALVREPEPDYGLDYGQTELQSGLGEPGQATHLITVTHQVPTRTIFTVVERGHTKSLFAEVLETSLEVVDGRSLRSTQINSSPVLYSSVQTKYPRFGVTELEYAAILPTPSLTTTVHSLSLGGRVSEVTETLETTNYSPSTLTTRRTQTQVAPSLPGGDGVGQISQIIQNVLLNLIGGGLLASQSQAAERRSELITHTRTFLLTQSMTVTNIIPVNFRGSEVLQSLTEVELVTRTTTDYSVQTLLSFQAPSDQPFYPLAPTLNRAVRIVPSENQYQPIVRTSLVTDTRTEVRTITTDLTSSLTITLGGRQVVTDIIEPTTTVVTRTLTRTALSTSTLVQEGAKSHQSAAVLNYINKLKLVKSLLGLSK